jgi:alpha-galactosidase
MTLTHFCRRFAQYWLAISIALACPALHAQMQLAPAPPMGWNSWDAYGITVREAEIRANAQWMAQHLKPYGWQYVVVDMEWFVENPESGDDPKTVHLAMDAYGRYLPAVNRFPSAANDAGFRPLADSVHALGLKFGIHMLRGIPIRAVQKNLPIAGSHWHAADAALRSDTCPWNPDNYGVDASKPAGQAWYDAEAKLWASWGVDYVKMDCVSGKPWPAGEVAMIHKAIARSGRPMVLSLSPGQSFDQRMYLRADANLWRVSNDVWDRWKHAPNTDYPEGLYNQFALAAQWSGFAQPNHWPDLDMLPLGRISIRSVIGKDRQSAFTHDEQRTLMTLWAIFRSPLMMGGDLPSSDAWTQSLLTNKDVLGIDQQAQDSHVVVTDDHHAVWMAREARTHAPILAVFNLDDQPNTYTLRPIDLGLKMPSRGYCRTDLWTQAQSGTDTALTFSLAAHASALVRLTPAGALGCR